MPPSNGIDSVRHRRAAWLAVVLAGLVGLPIAWSATLLRWLQFGAEASWKWPAATLTCAAITMLVCRWLANSSGRPVALRQMLSWLAVWCTAHCLCWNWCASPLGNDPLVMLAYLLTTGWLGWCNAMFFTPLSWPDRLKTFTALLLPLAGWFACVEAIGADGSGRPLAVLQVSPTAGAATRTDAITRVASDWPATRAADWKFTHPVGVATDADFPCFRGRDGLATIEGVRLARDWSSRPPRLVWRTSLGKGWSSFAIAEGRAFTQEQRGDQEAVVCYELSTGCERWVHVDAARFRGTLGGDGPRATPAVAEGHLYALGATGILNCLETTTGRRRWSIDILADNGAGCPFHGLSGSPLIVDRAVVISTGGPRGQSLAAYDRLTGKRLFACGDQPAGYSSPLRCNLGGQSQILVFNRPGVVAHNPTTGIVLWTFPWSNDQETNCSQPLPLDDNRILVSTGYGKGSALLAVRQRCGEWSVETLWTSRGLKCKFSSPVTRQGFVYGLDDGVLTCLDRADGSRRWRAGRYGHGQVLLVDDLLLVQTESGEMALVAATPDRHRELGRFPAIDGKTWNYPALAGSLLVVRNDHEAACYELPLEERPASQRSVVNALSGVP